MAVRTLCGHGPQAHIGGWTFAHGRNLRRYDASCWGHLIFPSVGPDAPLLLSIISPHIIHWIYVLYALHQVFITFWWLFHFHLYFFITYPWKVNLQSLVFRVEGQQMQALDEKAAQELWGWEGTRRGSIKQYIKSIKIINWKHIEINWRNQLKADYQIRNLSEDLAFAKLGIEGDFFHQTMSHWTCETSWSHWTCST